MKNKILLFPMLMLFASCNKTYFLSSSRAPAAKKTIKVPTPKEISKTQPNENDVSKPGGTIISPVPTQIAFVPTPVPIAVDPCGTNKNRQAKVLIADFKSGWFAGDGGNFFEQAIENACDNRVQLHYFHFTNYNLATNLINYSNIVQCEYNICKSFGDLRSYDAIFVFSGDFSDAQDLSANSALFQSLIARSKELRDSNPYAGFFVGAGLGNISHANLFAGALFPFQNCTADNCVFRPGQAKRGTFPSVTWPADLNNDYKSLRAGTGLDTSTIASNTRPFAAFSKYPAMTELLDYPKQTFQHYNIFKTMDSVWTCFADPLVPPSGAGIASQILATDHCSNPVIAKFKYGNHKMIAEGNMARFYYYTESAKEKYLHRLVLDLITE